MDRRQLGDAVASLGEQPLDAARWLLGGRRVVEDPPRHHQPLVRLDLLDRPDDGVAAVGEDHAVRAARLERRLERRAMEVPLRELGIGDRRPHLFGAGADEGLVHVHGSGRAHRRWPPQAMVDLDVLTQTDHRRDGRLGVLGDPALLDLADRDRVEVVQLRPPHLLGDDEPGPFEHGEVLHHAEPGDRREHLAQLAERLPVAGEQGVEQLAPPGVGEGLEHVVVISSDAEHLM